MLRDLGDFSGRLGGKRRIHWRVVSLDVLFLFLISKSDVAGCFLWTQGLRMMIESVSSRLGVKSAGPLLKTRVDIESFLFLGCLFPKLKMLKEDHEGLYT